MEQGLPNGFLPIIGTEEATIDDKGRLLFSKKKRDRIGKSFVITLGDLGCLHVIPQARYNTMLADLFASGSSLSTGQQDVARLQLTGLAEDDLDFDGQGRVVIPVRLRKAAGLAKDVVIIGLGHHAEIWDRTEFDKYQDNPTGYQPPRAVAVKKAKEAIGVR